VKDETSAVQVMTKTHVTGINRLFILLQKVTVFDLVKIASLSFGCR
jgi:hypothetical protein